MERARWITRVVAMMLLLCWMCSWKTPKGPTISSITSSPEAEVGLYDKFELTFELDDNRLDNDVRAEILTPSGKKITVFGFWDVDYRTVQRNGRFTDEITLERGPHWHVRYAPTETGKHTVTVTASNSSGKRRSTPQFFTCVPSKNPGYLRPDSYGRMRFSDGTPWTPIGFWVTMSPKKMDRLWDIFTSNGITFMRRWLTNGRNWDIYRGERADWSRDYQYDTVFSKSGRRSVLKEVSKPGTVVSQGGIGSKPLTCYKAWAYFRTDRSFHGKVAVKVNEETWSSKEPIYHIGNPITSGDNAWNRSEVMFQTTADTRELVFKPRVIEGSGRVWIDDVALYECDADGKAKINYNQIFTPSFEELTPDQLDMVNLHRFEHLLNRAEQDGIMIQPVFFDYKLWDKREGFYVKHFGDWRSEESLRSQEQVIRYLIARFGYSTSIPAWELTNEMCPDYSPERMNWIVRLRDFIKKTDPIKRPVVNSYWRTPACPEFEQALDIGTAHYYIRTEKENHEARVGGWQFDVSENANIDRSSGAPRSGRNCYTIRAGNGRTDSGPYTIYASPGKRYQLRGYIKTKDVNGRAEIRMIQVLPRGQRLTQNLFISGTCNYRKVENTVTTHPRAYALEIKMRLKGNSGQAWYDDITLTDQSGRNLLYNGGFEDTSFGDDEFVFSLVNNARSEGVYRCGKGGCRKFWTSGEFGMMGKDWGQSRWANPLAKTPRKDHKGLHFHNAMWAQLMVSAFRNSPAYSWNDDYIYTNDLWHIYKAPALFARTLPMIDGARTVCTESMFAEVSARSSNPKLRMIGQMSKTAGYFWIQNSDNTWAKVVREGHTPGPASSTFSLPGFTPGAYNVEFVDTWTGKTTGRKLVRVDAEGLRLIIEGLKEDVACRVVKQ